MFAVARTYLQPVGRFVERPPLDRKLALLALSLTAILGIVTVPIAAIITFRQAHVDVKTFPNACEIPDESARCNETTSYPKKVTVMLNPWGSVELTLNGPKHISASQIAEIIRGMTCEVSSESNFLIWKQIGVTQPADFHRACTNKLHPELTMRSYDDRIDYKIVLDWMSTLEQLVGTSYSFAHRLRIVELMVQRFPGSDDYPVLGDIDLVGSVGVGIAFDDNQRYYYESWMECAQLWDEWPLIMPNAGVKRDCHYGSPFYSDHYPGAFDLDRCPIEVNTYNGSLGPYILDIATHPSWQTIRSVLPNMSIVVHALGEICTGMRLTAPEFLSIIDTHNLEGPRSSDEIIRFIGEEVEKQCLYSFACTESRFNGYAFWFAVAYPVLALIAKALLTIAPLAYGVFHHQRDKRNSSAQACSSEEQKQISGAAEHSNREVAVPIRENFNHVVVTLKEELQQTWREELAEALRVCREDTANVRTRLDGLASQVHSLFDCILETSETATGATGAFKSEPIQTRMADLKEGRVDIITPKIVPSKAQFDIDDTSVHVIFHQIDAHIATIDNAIQNTEKLEVSGDAASSGVPEALVVRQKEHVPPLAERPETLRSIGLEVACGVWLERLTRLEQQHRNLDVFMWNLRKEVGALEWKVEHKMSNARGEPSVG